MNDQKKTMLHTLKYRNFCFVVSALNSVDNMRFRFSALVSRSAVPLRDIPVIYLTEKLLFSDLESMEHDSMSDDKIRVRREA